MIISSTSPVSALSLEGGDIVLVMCAGNLVGANSTAEKLDNRRLHEFNPAPSPPFFFRRLDTRVERRNLHGGLFVV